MAAVKGETSFILFGYKFWGGAVCIRALWAGWALKGSWFLAASTRFASRSNPQRMSMAWVANQMRAACAWSGVCTLGSSIMTRITPRPTRRACDSRQSLAQPRDALTHLTYRRYWQANAPTGEDTQNLSLPSPALNFSNTAHQIIKSLWGWHRGGPLRDEIHSQRDSPPLLN